MAQVISVVSGKGGVGKSTFVANLGKALADSGRSVVVIDTDIGLRSQDFLLSLENQVFFDLIDVTSGNCELSEAILPVSSVPNLFLVPAAQFSRVRALEPKKLRKMLRELKERYDFVLIDCPAGIERGFRNVLASGSDSFVLMVTPDDLCVRDAERTLQIMDAKKVERPQLVVNRLNPVLIAEGDMVPARSVASVLECQLLGELPEDPVVYRSMLHHTLFTGYRCEARDAVYRIAHRIQGESVPFPGYGLGKRSFWSRLFRPHLKEVEPLDNH